MCSTIYHSPSHSSPSGETMKPVGQFTQEYEPSEFRQMPFGHVDKERHSSISVGNNNIVGTFPFLIQNIKVLNKQKVKTTKVMNYYKSKIIACLHITSQYGHAENLKGASAQSKKESHRTQFLNTNYSITCWMMARQHNKSQHIIRLDCHISDYITNI